ncbi:uncharacterized protein LOC115755897 isoform X2 [Rhodamnia argentea]|uniref:Uncharacterized protein LOC115755897 isoform X2 n=1 Tax=Rhodamnia argentea TaxID=178133 RepID=A0ABM3GV37_9MYRT|nr:uncharacterized protein LOC115755897 isoform X2 [Rhodamnia argentea]
MDNGFDGKLADKFSGMVLNDASSNINSNNDSLFQVMKAVEAAEATIKQQVEENVRLRTELQEKMQELERYKSYESMASRHAVGAPDGLLRGVHDAHQSIPSVGNPEDGVNSIGGTSPRDQAGTIIVHKEVKLSNQNATRSTQEEAHSESNKVNGTLKVLAGPQVPTDNSGFSQLSSPSATSFSPNRYQTEGEYDRRLNFSGHGRMQMAEVNNSSSLQKQDLIHKVQEQEQEIVQLRRHLSDYSVKEAQVRNEKYVLEKRIAYMRMAFDQQQQDLVDAASKALSYRQDIMEENIRLSYQLQAAQQERLTFVSSLLPLLAEYSLQPPVLDAQSIVSNVKVLFKHLQEQLNVTETKLKESHFQLATWNSEASPSSFAPQSPAHSIGAALMTSRNGLELVPQPAFSLGNAPVSSDAQPTAGWDALNAHQIALGGGVLPKNMEPNDIGRYSPLASRGAAAHDVAGHFANTRGGTPLTHHSEETTKQVTFREPVSNTEMDDPDVEGSRNERQSPANWASGNSPYTAPLEDPGSSYSPYLPPVLEEPSSSFSEAAEDDPLPAIEGLQISGDAFPGKELQACGYSTNGTTSCNFEWVRHLEDGSINYIEGAKQPIYLVTADDVDTYLAIEVQPLDNRKRKGELVKVFANEHSKITCGSMQHIIERTLHEGHASYKVSLSTGYLDIWEPAILAVKREGYSIKCTASDVVVTEKFSPNTRITIPYGDGTAFWIIGSNDSERFLRAENSAEDISCSRDTIVLTLRLFILRAGERRKGKKRGLFFNK